MKKQERKKIAEQKKQERKRKGLKLLLGSKPERQKKKYDMRIFGIPRGKGKTYRRLIKKRRKLSPLWKGHIAQPHLLNPFRNAVK